MAFAGAQKRRRRQAALAGAAEIETHHRVNTEGPQCLRCAGRLQERAGSPPVEATLPKGLTVLQRLLHYLWLFCLSSEQKVSVTFWGPPDKRSSVMKFSYLPWFMEEPSRLTIVYHLWSSAGELSGRTNNENAPFSSVNYTLSLTCFFKMVISFQKSLYQVTADFKLIIEPPPKSPNFKEQAVVEATKQCM